jgi:tetratricopeptide (TPR) repeat protein
MACVSYSDPRLTSGARIRWRATAASAFYRAGVERHRRLYLSEIIIDFEASGSMRDPAHAACEKALIDSIDDQARERVAWYYQAAIAFAPDFAEPIYNLAVLRRNAGRLDDALSLFMRAARAQPHPRARGFLRANAFWEAASIRLVQGQLNEAESLFRNALHLLDNFGPEHVRFPRLLQRLGKNLEAADHYERITRYSHRYAQEFVEPDYEPDELLPTHPDGTYFDPAVLTRINGDQTGLFYFSHLYFQLAQRSGVIEVAQLSQALRRQWLLRRFGFGRLIRCAASPAELSNTSG